MYRVSCSRDLALVFVLHVETSLDAFITMAVKGQHHCHWDLTPFLVVVLPSQLGMAQPGECHIVDPLLDDLAPVRE
jgi:hypothetical protein